MRVIKYWLKIIRDINGKEHYVQKTYRELVKINIENPGIVKWVSGVKSLLESTGFGYIWQQQAVTDEKFFINTFKQRLIDIYLQFWISEVNLTSDNRLYKHVKNQFVFETYLRLNDRALRTSLTKIRLSSHLFYIERGRWESNMLDVKNRKCIICNKVEDEFHCLVECPKFNNERRGLLTSDLENNPCFYWFVKYFQTSDLKIQRKLALLCYKIQKEYKQLL